MRREVSPAVVILAVVAVLVVIGALWAYLQRPRTDTEAVRREVEEQMYREGELGHRPGQVPVPATPR